VGSLWTSGGQQLATATFSNESASGWQQVDFASPVPVAANTVYVASYHAPDGHYAGDNLYFASSGVDNWPVHLLSSPAAGGNGVYTYSAVPAFPSSTPQATNYWVNVVFTATTPPPPATATATVTS